MQLALNRPEQAIADYDAALALRPAMAASLYGRGLAYLKLSNSANGGRDIDAAQRIDPDIAAQFRRWGVPGP